MSFFLLKELLYFSLQVLLNLFKSQLFFFLQLLNLVFLVAIDESDLLCNGCYFLLSRLYDFGGVGLGPIQLVLGNNGLLPPPGFKKGSQDEQDDGEC